MSEINADNLETNEELAALRVEIDAVDEDIVACLVRRFALTDEVGEVKAKNGLPAFDPAREAKQMKRLKKFSQEFGVDKDALISIFESIFSTAKKRHEEIAQTAD